MQVSKLFVTALAALSLVLLSYSPSVSADMVCPPHDQCDPKQPEKVNPKPKEKPSKVKCKRCIPDTVAYDMAELIELTATACTSGEHNTDDCADLITAVLNAEIAIVAETEDPCAPLMKPKYCEELKKKEKPNDGGKDGSKEPAKPSQYPGPLGNDDTVAS